MSWLEFALVFIGAFCFGWGLADRDNRTEQKRMHRRVGKLLEKLR